MTIDHLKIKTFDKDGRKSIKELYASFEKLDKEFWIKETIHKQEFHLKRKKPKLEIVAFRTKLKGKALWIISGIHGEEPAGPNMISEHIGFLNDLAKKIPIVLLPLCNPVGYSLDWRHPDRRRGPRQQEFARSVGSSEHYLPSLNDSSKPRGLEPMCEEAADITKFILRRQNNYPPLLVLDFHEDESSTSTYIYSQGKLMEKDPVAKRIVEILNAAGFKIRMKGITSFKQKIIEGVVFCVNDGSVDELLASERVIVGGKNKRKKGANSVIVIETNTKGIPLQQRVEAHSEVLLSAEKFFETALEIKGKK